MSAKPTPIRGGQLFVLAAILLLALNLRAAVGSLGVLLPEVRAELGMSSTTAGVLTTIPVLCFAVFGLSTGLLTRLVGLHRTVVVGLVMIIAGLILRVLVHGPWIFVVCTALAVAGAAIGNVMLPGLAKQHFPDRLPLVSALYGAALVGGATITSASTVGLADALGGWRAALVFWTGLAVLALLPWLLLSRHEISDASGTTERWPLRRVARSPLAWTMAALFACQSGQAYAQFGWYPAMLVDGGLSAGAAAGMLAIITAVGIPMTLALPFAMRLTGRTPILPIGYGILTVLGWSGVLISPSTLPWLFALLLGIGSTAFTWVLAMISQRSRTAAGTVGLSTFVQGIGYLIASIGPFGTGALHGATGSWSPPLIGLMVLGALIAVFGTMISRPRFVEDELARRDGPIGPGAE